MSGSDVQAINKRRMIVHHKILRKEAQKYKKLFLTVRIFWYL